MKTILQTTFIFTSIALVGYDLLNQKKPIEEDIAVTIPVSERTEGHSICETFFQDVSGSIIKNGIEIEKSDVFEPYYQAVNINIELYYGVIENLTAKKLIHLELPKRYFLKPNLSDLTKLDIVERRKEKAWFLEAEKKYIADSIQFYTDRNQRIQGFKTKVDAKVALYEDNLTNSTDMITAVDIADKVFSYPVFSNSKNYLLLNSDGLDSYKRKAKKLKNSAEVILINSGNNIPTSVDAVITRKLQATEQAIMFTLSNNSKQ